MNQVAFECVSIAVAQMLHFDYELEHKDNEKPKKCDPTNNTEQNKRDVHDSVYHFIISNCFCPNINAGAF